MTILVIPLAFLCEFVDSSLGMGFGTILSPVLLFMGFEALDVVPSILFSECITGMTAALAHHRVRNVDFHATFPGHQGGPGAGRLCRRRNAGGDAPGHSPAPPGAADLDRDAGARDGRADPGGVPAHVSLHVAPDRYSGDRGFVQQGAQRRRIRSLGDRRANALRDRRPQCRRDYLALGRDHLPGGIHSVLPAEARRQLVLDALHDGRSRALRSRWRLGSSDEFPKSRAGLWWGS